jgi:thioredoxin 1
VNATITNKQILEVDGADFESEVLKSDRPVLVAFLAPWSQPCREIKPILERVAANCAERAKVVKVNIDKHGTLGANYRIDFVPALLCFVNGNECARIVGLASKEEILSKL